MNNDKEDASLSLSFVLSEDTTLFLRVFCCNLTVLIIASSHCIANTTKSGINGDNSNDSDQDITDFHNDFLSKEINNKQNNETELSHL